MQKEDENLEDFIQIFSYNVKRFKMYNLDEETLKALLLNSIKDERIDLISFMGKGDISLLSFGYIFELCIYISRGKARTKKNPRDSIMSRINKFETRKVSRVEIGNFLDNFKTNIFGFLVKK